MAIFLAERNHWIKSKPYVTKHCPRESSLNCMYFETEKILRKPRLDCMKMKHLCRCNQHYIRFRERKGKKNINAEKNEDIELTHTQVLCGSLLTVTKNKLYRCHRCL